MEKGGPGSADGTAFYSDDRYFFARRGLGSVEREWSGSRARFWLENGILKAQRGWSDGLVFLQRIS